MTAHSASMVPVIPTNVSATLGGKVHIATSVEVASGTTFKHTFQRVI